MSEPIRLAAMKRLYALVGPQEPWGPNWGPLIQRWGALFLSPSRLQSFAPGQVNEGRLLWCALTVCGAVQDELLARGHLELAAQWKKIASAEVSALWSRMDARGWVWRRGAALPDALGGGAGTPQPGDFVFYGVAGAGRLGFVHVDFFKAPLTGEDFESIGGNTGTPPKVDRIDYVQHRGPAKLARVLGYGRLPW